MRIKHAKKWIMAMAVTATFFSNGEVLASESVNEASTPAGIEEIYQQLTEINRRLENQEELQEEMAILIERLKNIELETLNKSSDVLINPGSGKVSYMQDAGNSQDNSMVTFKYAPNQLYKIYCRVGYLTDLTLKKGETITFVGGGDTSAWAVEKSIVDGVPHIYLKPTVETSTTNMIITTNKRSYQLILNTSNFYNSMVSWNYGLEEIAEMPKLGFQNPFTKINGNVESLNFSYKISGKSENKPVTVFDDGEKTILKFEKMPKRLPSLFVKNKGKFSMVNYKIFDNCYIMNGVADEIEMRISDKEIIKIKRGKW